MDYLFLRPADSSYHKEPHQQDGAKGCGKRQRSCPEDKPDTGKQYGHPQNKAGEQEYSWIGDSWDKADSDP